MPRGKRMPFAEYIARMEGYYPNLKRHRIRELHIDPIFCEDCCNEMSRGSDRARYMGKTLMRPGGTISPDMEETFNKNEVYRLVLKDNRTMAALVSYSTGGGIRPTEDGNGWEGFLPEESEWDPWVPTPEDELDPQPSQTAT